MALSDNFTAVSAGVGVGAVTAVVTWAVCNSIPSGSFLAQQGWDLVLPYAAILLAPAFGLAAGAGTAIAVRRDLKKKNDQGPKP